MTHMDFTLTPFIAEKPKDGFDLFLRGSESHNSFYHKTR